MKYLKDMFGHFETELHIYKSVLSDSRTPRLAKWLLGFAIGYAVCPFDIIPDFIPLLGYLDDVLIIPIIVIIAIRLIPKEIITDCREKAKQALVSQNP